MTASNNWEKFSTAPPGAICRGRRGWFVLNLGLLFSLNAPFIALSPPLLILMLALVLIYRFDRRS
jgi:hypothetical protein